MTTKNDKTEVDLCESLSRCDRDNDEITFPNTNSWLPSDRVIDSWIERGRREYRKVWSEYVSDFN